MEQILNNMKNLVEQKLGKGYTVLYKEHVKNNGTVVWGFRITDNRTPTICPVVYVDKYAAEVQAGNMTECEAADVIIAAYKEADKNWSIDTISLTSSKQGVLDHVVYHLINTKMNSAGLSAIPHRNYLDLSVIYRINFEVSGRGYASAGVDNKLCRDLGITKAELDAAARHNTAAKGFKQKPIPEILEEITDSQLPYMGGPLMQVFTTKNYKYGAAVMLYPQQFEGFARSVSNDLFILPSSIHELIAIPTGEMSLEELRSIVKEINATEVSADEVLSENVYHYSLETGKITIA